ncbi:MAG: toll/interleukin-1 receptor domain-containing protein, partial [Candidatus Helarchaeota archaeon]|nr:toll/interleukin-1 receptor domain-containing protein [Candidatus Helarchaeota archaeon]
MSSNKKNKLFFSYAEKDSERLKIPDIAKVLEHEKYAVYYYQKGNEFLGEKIKEDIAKNIKDSKIFIGFFTKSYQ